VHGKYREASKEARLTNQNARLAEEELEKLRLAQSQAGGAGGAAPAPPPPPPPPTTPPTARRRYAIAACSVLQHGCYWCVSCYCTK